MNVMKSIRRKKGRKKRILVFYSQTEYCILFLSYWPPISYIPYSIKDRLFVHPVDETHTFP